MQECRFRRRAPADASWQDVLWVVAPAWSFLAASRVVFYTFESMRYPDLIPPVSNDALQGALLFPLVFLGCCAVLGAWRRWNRAAGIAALIATAVLFAGTARPAYGVAMFILSAGDPDSRWASFMDPQAKGFLYMWLANAVEYAALYVSCVASSLGFLAYRGLARERELRAELEIAATRERLRALRTQINPHFLFNALNSLVGVGASQSSALAGLIGKLGDLLNHTLTAGDQEEHSVAAEFSCINAYLEIEVLRHPDRLRVHSHYDARCSELGVPTLILLPLVENAVKHGLRSQKQQVDIDVHARTSGNRLELTVRNTCRCGPLPMRTKAGGGRGFKLVRDRLAMQFGFPAALHMWVNESAQFVARIDIPLPDSSADASAEQSEQCCAL